MSFFSGIMIGREFKIYPLVFLGQTPRSSANDYRKTGLTADSSPQFIPRARAGSDDSFHSGTGD